MDKHACIYCGETEAQEDAACSKCREVACPTASTEQFETELNCAMIASMVTAKSLGHTGEAVRDAARYTLTVIKPMWGIL